MIQLNMPDPHSRLFFRHRDIKSANVLVSLADGRRLVKVADFGSARAALAAGLPKQQWHTGASTAAGARGAQVEAEAPTLKAQVRLTCQDGLSLSPPTDPRLRQAAGVDVALAGSAAVALAVAAAASAVDDAAGCGRPLPVRLLVAAGQRQQLVGGRVHPGPPGGGSGFECPLTSTVRG